MCVGESVCVLGWFFFKKSALLEKIVSLGFEELYDFEKYGKLCCDIFRGLRRFLKVRSYTLKEDSRPEMSRTHWWKFAPSKCCNLVCISPMMLSYVHFNIYIPLHLRTNLETPILSPKTFARPSHVIS